MELYAGTSGFSFREWKGSFYPEDLPAKGMLHYYGEQFRTVEINNTFHRMPKPAVLENWAGLVPEEFRFVLKAPQRITHILRLKDAGDSISYLFEAAQALRQHQGPLLFQLPPDLKKDIDRLHGFMRQVRPRCCVALEFRHPSWFDEEVFALMRQHNVALCIAEAEEGVVVPFVSTADWGYLRLRRSEYNDADLLKRLEQIRQQNWREAFVFFKHEEEGKGPMMARRFLELAA